MKHLKESRFQLGLVPIIQTRARYDWGIAPDLTFQDYLNIADLDTDFNMETQVESGDLNLPTALTTGEHSREGFSIDFIKDLDMLQDSKAYVLDYNKALFNDNPNSVIVSKMVLDANALEVGDTFILDLNSAYTDKKLEKLDNQKLNIVGSYSIEPTDEMVARELEYTAEDSVPNLDFTYMNDNLIMPQSKGFEILNILIKNDITAGESFWVDEIYYLDSVDEVKQFDADAEALTGISLDVRFNTYDNEDLDGLERIASIKEVMRYFLVLALVIVIILLSVLITLFARTRRKEIGILVALGEHRVCIYKQLVLEQLIIMTLGFVVPTRFVL